MTRLHSITVCTDGKRTSTEALLRRLHVASWLARAWWPTRQGRFLWASRPLCPPPAPRASRERRAPPNCSCGQWTLPPPPARCARVVAGAYRDGVRCTRSRPRGRLEERCHSRVRQPRQGDANGARMPPCIACPRAAPVMRMGPSRVSAADGVLRPHPPPPPRPACTECRDEHGASHAGSTFAWTRNLGRHLVDEHDLVRGRGRVGLALVVMQPCECVRASGRCLGVRQRTAS